MLWRVLGVIVQPWAFSFRMAEDRGRSLIEEQDPAHLVPHFKITGPETQPVRADQVPEVQAPADGGGLIEGKILFLAGAEEVVEDT
ncbi:hypothetical protein, partial [uncultured Oscillibacter sp.]|uniref:hypothetical protein n=1 Tax=uncultured Oscillibacter sp. TaxID=876091 RepID=UPI002606B4FE